MPGPTSPHQTTAAAASLPASAHDGVTAPIAPGDVPHDVGGFSFPGLAHASRALRDAGRPKVLVVMGVSGSGKSTLAGELSFALRWPLVEGDSLHPQANILKMSTGVPLTDADRQPWLEDIGRVVRDWIDSDTCGVITCSSLKRRYRDTISGGNTRVCFVYVKGAQADIAPRLNRRTGHFMPSTMLDSQFAALEEPGEDECVLSVDVRASRDSLTKATLDALDGLTA